MVENNTFGKAEISVLACDYRRVLEMISSKWKVLVLHALENGSKRYRQLEKSIEDISQKMLTQKLRQLERDGLVKRNIHPTVPQMVNYELTDLGESLLVCIRKFKTWTKLYYPFSGASAGRMTWVNQSTMNNGFKVTMLCDSTHSSTINRFQDYEQEQTITLTEVGLFF